MLYNMFSGYYLIDRLNGCDNKMHYNSIICRNILITLNSVFAHEEKFNFIVSKIVVFL
jgi:hypothetical protein